jgi:hypothetical protein
MFNPNMAKVRPANGPSRSNRCNCTTPNASELNTKGTTTKNSILRKTWPNGSNPSRLIHRIHESHPGPNVINVRAVNPSAIPITNPNMIRRASRSGRFALACTRSIYRLGPFTSSDLLHQAPHILAAGPRAC